MTLIDLAALLAKYSFFPNLSLSWLLWLLISQLQKPPWMQRDFSALRLPSLSVSLSLYILCLLFFPSLVPAHLAVSVSHFRTFSLIWQQSEPCRWKSFQRISRKLIYFCNKYDPTQVNTSVYFKMYKTGSGSGPHLPLLHTPGLSFPVYPTHCSHTHTHILVTKSLFSPLLSRWGGFVRWFVITCTQGCVSITVNRCNCCPFFHHNWLQEWCGLIRRAAPQWYTDWPGNHW